MLTPETEYTSTQFIRDRLHTLAEKVEPIMPASGARLRDLGDAVAGGPTADAWAGNDLFRLVDPDAIATLARHNASHDRFLGVLEFFRNALVLTPLLITWAGISFATSAYQRLLEAAVQAGEDTYKLVVEQPFLFLWENGFRAGGLDGGLVGPPLSVLALIDGILIGVVFILTLIVHGRTNLMSSRKEQEAELLQVELQSTLADASLALVTRRRQQPGNFVDRFDAMSMRLLDEIANERERLGQLATQREKEFGDLSAFTPQLVESAQNMLAASRNIQQAQSQNAQHILAASQEMSQAYTTGTQQVLEAAQQIGKVHSEGTRNILAATQETRQSQQELVTGMSQSHHEVAAGISALAALVQEMAGQQQALLADNRMATESLREFTVEYMNQGRDLRALIEGLQSALTSLNLVAAQTSEVAAQAGALADQISGAQARLLEALAKEREAQGELARLVSHSTVDLEKAVHEVNEVARTLHSIAVDISDLARVILNPKVTSGLR
jgi:hypothetical protein